MSARPILIMAGGTGGHVYPGLAVAEVLRAREQAVVWLGTHRGLEARAVAAAGIEMCFISIAGLRRRGAAAWLLAPFTIAYAVAQALAALARVRPAAVLGMGGFVAGPGGIAAWLTRRPLVIHEQNAIAGTTNRWLARLARTVFEAFPGSFPPRTHARWIGNPVRAAITALPAPGERFTARAAGARARLLVLGGSQGARAINLCVPGALARLPAEVRPDVRHQAGRGLEETRARYAELGVEGELVEFVDDMAAAYGWADLVVSRAGALTIAELCAAGVGAILIPYPYAVDDHQTHNARQFTANGAGSLIPEPELDAERLAGMLAGLLAAPERLRAMAEKAREQARPEAATELADECTRLAEGAR